MTEYFNEQEGYSYDKSEEVRLKRQKMIYVDNKTRYLITDPVLKQKFKEQRERWEAFKKKRAEGDYYARFTKKQNYD